MFQPAIYKPWSISNYLYWFLESWTTFKKKKCKFGFTVTPLQGTISLQNFAHAWTEWLLCHVQNFIAITPPQHGRVENEIFIDVELWSKNLWWMGPCPIPFVVMWTGFVALVSVMMHCAVIIGCCWKPTWARMCSVFGEGLPRGNNATHTYWRLLGKGPVVYQPLVL